MPGRRSPRARPGASRFQRTANSGSCSSPTARTRRCAASCARPWRRFRISATEGASRASSTACTASPPIRRGTSTRPRRTKASACRNSSIKAWARSRRGARACCGRAPGEILMRRARDAFTGLALLFSAAGALSQGFPSKAVHIVVPFPPGGGADTLARIMEPRLAAIWAQAIVVENRPGASGHIGADFVAKSAPDGHTLLMSSTASLTEKNVGQFAPVSLVSASAYVVTVNPKVAASDIRGLIALAKASPGKLSFGSSGTGAASHLSAELFKSMAGVDLLHVPYKGTGQALTDLLAGHVNLMFGPWQTVMPHVQSGRLRVLGVTGARRSQTLPDLPTVAESGLPGYEAVGWFGLLAPAATPKATVAKLSADANRVLAMRDVREKMLGLGAEPAGNTPEEFARFICGDQAKWSRLMKEAGITPE